MAITKDQALKLRHGNEVHFGECTKVVGPKGGIKLHVNKARVTGYIQTWKRDESRFRLPVMHGLRGYGAITNDNCEYFHMPEDCPTNE